MRQVVIDEIHQWELNAPKYDRFFNWLENKVEVMESEPKLEELYEKLEDFSKVLTRRDFGEIRKIVFAREDADAEGTGSLNATSLDSSSYKNSLAANTKSDLLEFDIDMLSDISIRKFWHKHKILV
jgi:hypothetical protein